jgi:predicted dehydrogenase
LVDMLRIAILGVGWAGTRHVEAIRELGRKLTPVCLVDSDTSFLRRQSAELEVEKTYPDYREALADPAVDAVSICLPHTLHATVAVAAAEAGKHILCEKPIAMTVDEATSMIEAADANGVKLFVAENQSYTARAKFMRQIVQSGEYIGELTFASMVTGFRAQDFAYPGRRAWLTLLDQGGTGTWMLHGVHSMAELRTIFGEVATVYVREHKASSYRRCDLEGTVSGTLTLEGGVPVSIVQTSETRLPDYLSGYTVHGDKGSVRALSEGCEVYGEERDRGGSQPLWIPYPTVELSEYAQEMEAFADYVEGIAEGPTTGRSERRTLAIVQAGYESMESGQAVDLHSRFGVLD